MSLATKLLSASGGVTTPPTYVDDVFSAYTYTGNGSIQTITNGIDLAGKGGMVWIKSRTSATHPHIYDTNRGANKYILPTGTAAEATGTAMGLFNSSGFRVEGGVVNTNGSGANYASWTFRKAKKFFDVVTYTGTGANRTISHALGQEVGMIYVKRTDTAADWQVYHRSLANTEYMALNSTAAKATGATRWNSTTPTTSVFSVGTDTTVNASGGTYVAYLFAHDTSTDGIVQCGSFTTDASGNATVNLGWEPQYLIVKKTTLADWMVFDTARGWSAGGAAITPTLSPNATYAEYSAAPGAGNPTATGFAFKYEASSTYIYLAIRRPNKPPTTGTQVYNAIARTGTGAAATVTGVGFAPDLIINKWRNGSSGAYFVDRLRGASKYLQTTNNTPETTGNASNDLTAFQNDGFSVGLTGTYTFVNWSGASEIYHNFKRAPGVFDEVCYIGNNGNPSNFTHSLGVVPELMIVKRRSESSTSGWPVYYGSSTNFLLLNSTNRALAYQNFFITSPTASAFYVGFDSDVGALGATYVNYLFATKAGISKVFSYTGNGSSQTIDCGFTTGARFVMIKRTDAVGDWYVWDTVRGLVAGNDPHLSLNSTVIEDSSDDSIDPASVGFIVNQLAVTNINVNAASYIYLAFA